MTAMYRYIFAKKHRIGILNNYYARLLSMIHVQRTHFDNIMEKVKPVEIQNPPFRDSNNTYLWSLMPFSTIVQSHHGGKFIYSSVPGFRTPVLHTTYFPSSLLIIRIDCQPICGSRMTLVTVTFVKCRIKCWRSWDSNSQPYVDGCSRVHIQICLVRLS